MDLPGSAARKGGMRLVVAIAAVAALAMGTITSGAGKVPRWTSISEHGVAGRIPPAWNLAQGRLVRNLINPREVMTVGTGPLPAGAGGNCGRYPAAAMAAMRGGDRLVSIQTSPKVEGAKWFGRLDVWPDHAQLPKARPMLIADGPEPRVAHRVFTQRLDVREGDSYFWIFVAYASPPTHIQIEQAERILDTIEVS
jgi:hypothetical protein